MTMKQNSFQDAEQNISTIPKSSHLVGGTTSPWSLNKVYYHNFISLWGACPLVLFHRIMLLLPPPPFLSMPQSLKHLSPQTLRPLHRISQPPIHPRNHNRGPRKPQRSITHTQKGRSHLRFDTQIITIKYLYNCPCEQSRKYGSQQ